MWKMVPTRGQFPHFNGAAFAPYSEPSLAQLASSLYRLILQPESKPLTTSPGSTGRWGRGLISSIFGARMAPRPSAGTRKGIRMASSCSNQSLPQALLQGTASILWPIHSFYLLSLHIFLLRDPGSRHKLRVSGDQLPLCLTLLEWR